MVRTGAGGTGSGAVQGFNGRHLIAGFSEDIQLEHELPDTVADRTRQLLARRRVPAVRERPARHSPNDGLQLAVMGRLVVSL